MSVNKYAPHILVLPEDKANQQIANGFVLNTALNARAIQVLTPAGGWQEVLSIFVKNHAEDMNRHTERRMILLVDFDGQKDRREVVMQKISDDLKDRVFVLGVWSEPENLRTLSNRSFESIGKTLAQECQDNALSFWNHALLRHNTGEIERTGKRIRLILFPES